jgi:hypothetical protein
VRRLFWLGIGVAVGVLVVRRITKTAEAYTPKGLASAVSGLGDTVREFAADVRVAMAEREDEMLDALGVSGADEPEGPSSAASGKHGR